MNFNQLDAELRLVERLEQHGIHVFTGLTTSAERKMRIRTAIETVGSSVISGVGSDGKPQTYAQEFEQTFRESLTPPSKVRAKDTADPETQSAPAATGSVV